MQWTFSNYPILHTKFIAALNQDMARRGILDNFPVSSNHALEDNEQDDDGEYREL
jgi:hypothetical protein